MAEENSSLNRFCSWWKESRINSYI